VKVIADDAASQPVGSVKLLSPVANPGKLIAAPVNYQKHLEEVKSDVQIHANNPGHTLTIQSAGLFLKATSSLVGPGEGVAIRMPERRTDHEVELAVVIGREGSRISRATRSSTSPATASASTSRSAARIEAEVAGRFQRARSVAGAADLNSDPGTRPPRRQRRTASESNTRY
jgi:hypothetical protein